MSDLSDVESMPQSVEEWAAHRAFYRLTVAQRDAAWAQLAAVKRLRFAAPVVDSADGEGFLGIEAHELDVALGLAVRSVTG